MIANSLAGLRGAGLVLAWVLLGAASAQAPHTHEHSFAGAEHWAKVFDDPARDAWQKPHQVIEALHLAPGAAVADIGAGTGYFTVRLAHMNPTGRVFAEDIEPDMVKYVSERARQANLDNVTAVLGRPEDPKLPERVDLVLVVDTYHHIGGREEFFRNLQASLKPGGRVAIIDFTRESPFGPSPEARIAPAEVKKEMTAAGYSLAAEHTFLPDQYFLIYHVSP
jgi:cyclopropane fatty-acyl-phospholipid synthase-like methyltransferase